MNKNELIGLVGGHLSEFGQFDKKILKALEEIDRKDFVPKDVLPEVYEDMPLPIGEGQTISQPSTVARMISLLNLKKGEDILEVGAGSGWNASLMAYIVRPGKVVTTEIYKSLAKKAEKRIKDVGISNVEVSTKDFRKLRKKFDKIIFTAGIGYEQEEAMEDYAQKALKPGGLMLCPHRAGPLIIFKKSKNKIKKEYTKEEYMFVPLL